MNTLSWLGGSGFQVAQASVAGAAHARRGRNNQDGLAVRAGCDSLCAVVCDGCGSGRATEVGALLAAQLLAARLGELDPPARDASREALGAAIDQAAAALLDDLGRLLARLPGERPLLVEDHFLFTIVGAWLTPVRACLFALGDGVWGLNGACHALGPFPDNAPPYLGYRLLRSGAEPALRLELLAELPTTEVASLVLASDGALPLLDGAGGGEELTAWCADPRLFANPDALRRRLWQLGRPRPGAPPLLDDDTTLVLIRRLDEGVH